MSAATATAVAAGLNTGSSYASASNASKQSSLNARLLESQAKAVARQTGSQVSQIRAQGDRALGQQSASFADNGTGSGGSNALIQRSTAIDTEMSAANADYSGRLQMANLQTQANAQRALAKSQRPTLLSLLGSAASTYAAS